MHRELSLFFIFWVQNKSEFDIFGVDWKKGKKGKKGKGEKGKREKGKKEKGKKGKKEKGKKGEREAMI